MTIAREETTRLVDLLGREHHALAEFLVALATFDRERRWVELGHSSLFYFLTRELRLPNGPAYYRKTAAELIQRFPEIVEPLRDGRLHLTSLVELSKVITRENRAEVLPRFFHRSKREAKEVSAALAPEPAPALRTVVTAVRAPGAGPAPTDEVPAALGASPRADAAARPDTLALGPASTSALLPEEPARASSTVREVAPAPVSVRTSAPPLPVPAPAKCGTTYRRAPTPPSHRLPPPPRQARRRPRRPLPLPPRRDRGRDPRGRARPHPRAVREAPRAGEEAEDARLGDPGRQAHGHGHGRGHTHDDAHRSGERDGG